MYMYVQYECMLLVPLTSFSFILLSPQCLNVSTPCRYNQAKAATYIGVMVGVHVGVFLLLGGPGGPSHGSSGGE